MKLTHYLSSLCSKILFGGSEKINIQRSPEEGIVDEAWKKYCGEIRHGCIQNKPFDQVGNLLIDTINAELMYSNYKSLERLNIAIERFNIRSTELSIRMIILSVIMSILVIVQICIEIF
jgi:hypothetical protein